jgi:hypothetical protein
MPVLTVVLPVAGLILCIPWFLLTERGFDYHNYYVLSARELEEHYLSDPVKTVSRDGSFGKGESITLEIGGRTTDVTNGRPKSPGLGRTQSREICFVPASRIDR